MMTKGNHMLSSALLRFRKSSDYGKPVENNGRSYDEDDDSSATSGTAESSLLEMEIEDVSEKGGSRQVKVPANHRAGGSFRVPVRKLAFAILALLLPCHLLVFSVWRSGLTKKQASAEPLITGWKLNTKTKSAKVRLRARETARAVGYIPAGSEVQAYSYKNSDKFLYLVEPVSGFALKKLFTPTDTVHETSPFMYEGLRLAGHNTSARYLYAPKLLVVAQQLWNAVQVLHMFLVICLYYQHIYKASHLSFRARVIVATTSITLHCLLVPLSAFAISPGAAIFSILAYIISAVGLLYGTDLEVAVGDDGDDDDDGKSEAIDTDPDKTFLLDEESLAAPTKATQAKALPSWFLVKEETLGLLCNLASSLYNYHGSRATWPNWESQFYSVDRFFGWMGANREYLEVFPKGIYTLGLVDHVPMYMPRAVGSTFGALLFWILWAVIPILYVSYFLAMYVLAERSPGVKVQRALLLFCIFHFLFFTDIVSYKYGRGMWSPNMELFHWFERWAWRVAILMPIYQNCTTGHWKHGHRFSLVGATFHYTIACWGCLFFVFQVLFSDLVRFVLFLMDFQVLTLYQIYHFGGPKIGRFSPFSYHGGLVVMWGMYLVLLVGGFAPFYVSLKSSGAKRPERPSSRSMSVAYGHFKGCVRRQTEKMVKPMKKLVADV